MGCAKSKLRRVVPQQTVEQWASTNGAKKPWKRSPRRQRRSNESVETQSRKNSKPGDTVLKRPTIIHVQESPNSSDGGSFSHFMSSSSRRIGSASTQIRSASSTMTKTSGLQSSSSGFGDEYSHIITEMSPIADRERAELPPGLAAPDLTLSGRKLRTPPHSSHRKSLPPIKKRTAEPAVMPKYASSGPSPVQKRIALGNILVNGLPDSPNIIKRPSSRGGMAFDIMMDDTSSKETTSEKPPRLQRLEKKPEPVTLRDLVEKQRDAKLRRDASSGPCPVQKHITLGSILVNSLPDSPNIIKRPSSRGGMAFDIMMDDTGSEATAPKKPPCLQRLEKKSEPVTLRDLVEKQRDAKMRREGHEQMKLERIRAQKEKDKQVTEALEKFSAMQKRVRAEVENKMKATTENREAHLKALCDRLKEKSDKVEEVKNARRVRKLPPLTYPSIRRCSIEERAVNLGAN